MKKVAFVIYREWAHEIYKNIYEFQKENPNFEISVLITTKEREFPVDYNQSLPKVYEINGKDNEKIDSILSGCGVDVVFYYGWSWIVKEPILSKYTCLCLHPSPLPRYRGGSPIQNQIIAGETISAVSIFKMGEGLDDGDIYSQLPMSLDGELKDIFERMISLGTDITKNFIIDLIDDNITFAPQKLLEENPPLKRRKPEDGELLLQNIEKMKFKEFYNIVRALADPYPNAYINFNDKKILLKRVGSCNEVGENGVVLNVQPGLVSPEKGNPFYVKLLDCYALITAYRVE